EGAAVEVVFGRALLRRVEAPGGVVQELVLGEAGHGRRRASGPGTGVGCPTERLRRSPHGRAVREKRGARADARRRARGLAEGPARAGALRGVPGGAAPGGRGP